MSSPTDATPPPTTTEETCKIPTTSELHADKIKQYTMNVLLGTQKDPPSFSNTDTINIEDTKKIFERFKGIDTKNKDVTELFLNGINEENALEYYTLITSVFNSSSCDSIEDYPILKLTVDTIQDKYKDKISIKKGGSASDTLMEYGARGLVGLMVFIICVIGSPYLIPYGLAMLGTNQHFKRGGKGKKQQTKRKKHSHKNSKSRRINKNK